MTQDTRPSGASIRQRVFGEASVQRTATAPAEPFLAPFFETAIALEARARRTRSIVA
jgi:hypothetical protein